MKIAMLMLLLFAGLALHPILCQAGPIFNDSFVHTERVWGRAIGYSLPGILLGFAGGAILAAWNRQHKLASITVGVWAGLLFPLLPLVLKQP